MTTAVQYPDTLPLIEGESAEWWAALAHGRLLIEKCRDCGALANYPRGFCSSCWSDNVEWLKSTGRATVYTFSIVRVNDAPCFRDRLPYVVAVVELDEGVRMMSNLVDVDPEQVSVGMPVTLRIQPVDMRIGIPTFVPEAAL